MPSVQIKRFFGLLVVVGSLLVSTLMSSGLFNPTPTYADAQIIEVGDGCYADDGLSSTTTHKSPFSQTSNVCLGRDSDYAQNSTIYYQFAVKLPSAISDANIQAINGNGNRIKFVKQSNTLYVSKLDDSAGSGFRTAKRGYAAQTINVCDSNSANNKITVTAYGNRSTDSKVFNLCDTTSPGQALIYWSPNLVGDDGQGGDTGTLKWKAGVTRPETAESKDDDRRLAPMQADGITFIRLTKDGEVLRQDQNGQGDWFTITDGIMTIDKLEPGTYELAVTYDDMVIARTVDNYPYDPAATITLNFTNLQVQAGQTTWVDGTRMSYYTPEDGVDPASIGVDESNDEPVCSAGSFGWLLCPLVYGLADLNDSMFSIVGGLLETSPLNDSSTNNTNDTYKIWGAMRDIANVVLVIGFIMIIFSQATSIGISNYGIKKLLPKLVAVAILINASWIVMQIATDLANITGRGLHDLLVALAPPFEVRWSDFLEGVVAAGAGAAAGFVAISTAGGLSAAIWLVLPPIIAAALALLVGMLTLFVRQALIIILVVLAPLAIACYLLPGTESWFKRWQKLLISMLMLYPLAALVFGGAQLAASIVSSTQSPLNHLIALVIMAAPLFSLPWLARQGGDILGKVSGALGKIASGANKPVGTWAKEKSELAKERNLAKPIPTSTFRKRFTPLGRAQDLDRRKRMRELEINAFKSQRSDDFNQSIIESNLADEKRFKTTPGAQRYLRSTAAKAESEQLKAAVDAMRIDPSVNTGDRDELKAEFIRNIELGTPEGIIKAKAAAHLLMQARGGDKIREAIGELGKQFTPAHASQIASTLLNSDNSSITFDTTPDMFKWASAGGKQPLSTYTQDPGSYRLSAAAMSKASGGTLQNIAKAPTTDDRAAAKQLIANEQFMGQKSIGDQISIYKIAGIAEADMPADIRQAALEAAERDDKKRQQAAQAGAGPVSINVTEPTQGEFDLSMPSGTVIQDQLDLSSTPPQTQPTQAPPIPPSSYTDNQGRQTPGNVGDSDDYHDGMQR